MLMKCIKVVGFHFPKRRGLYLLDSWAVGGGITAICKGGRFTRGKEGEEREGKGKLISVPHISLAAHKENRFLSILRSKIKPFLKGFCRKSTFPGSLSCNDGTGNNNAGLVRANDRFARCISTIHREWTGWRRYTGKINFSEEKNFSYCH